MTIPSAIVDDAYRRRMEEIRAERAKRADPVMREIEVLKGALIVHKEKLRRIIHALRYLAAKRTGDPSLDPALYSLIIDLEDLERAV